MFDWRGWVECFRSEPGYNNAVEYGVTVLRHDSPSWRVIGIHHLTPSENRGKRNLFIDVLDKNGRRVEGAVVHWVWEGMRPEQRPGPLVLNKRPNEIADIAMGSGQKVKIWIDDDSDLAGLFHTGHPDEHGPNGEVWNSIGHHSFLCVFQETGGTTLPPKPEPVPPPGVKVVGKVTLNVSSLEPDEDGNVTLDIAIEAD